MNDNIYKVKWDSEEDGKLFGISIVDMPANMYETIQLSDKEEPKKELNFEVIDEKKKQLAGVVLIPGQLILRYDEETEQYYKVFFDAETIEKLSAQFLRGGYVNNSWYNHDRTKKVEGNTVIESWIVENPDNDKANELGFKDLVKGTWCAVMQLSDQAWEKYVESGKVKGFSIDSIMSMEKIELKYINKNKEELNMENYIKTFLDLLKKEVNASEIEPKKEDEIKAEEAKKEEIKAEDVKKEEIKAEDKEDEMSMEDMKDELYKMIEQDPELLEVIKERYSLEDKVKEQEEALSKKEEEMVEMKKTIEAKELELKDLNEKLEKEPSDGKLKAKVNLKKEDINLSTSEKLARIIEKNKKK